MHRKNIERNVLEAPPYPILCAPSCLHLVCGRKCQIAFIAFRNRMMVEIDREIDGKKNVALRYTANIQCDECIFFFCLDSKYRKTSHRIYLSKC